ncbi:MAG: hypothetical protein R2818_01520 [Flavobacteriales bacterium]
MQEDQHIDELKDLPVLGKMPKRNPFMAPEGFFDHFPHAVQHLIVDAPRHSPWAWLFTSWVPRIATVLLLVIGSIAWFQWPEGEQGIASAEPGEQVLPYELLDMEFDEDLIFATLAHDEPVMNTVDLALSEREMTAYVEYEDLSLELLIEEL